MMCVIQSSYGYRRGTRCLSGVTLVELMTSMAIISVLMGAMGSAVFLATKALPGSDSTVADTFDAAQVSNDIATELRYAITFTQRLPNTVEFTVADRNNDLVAETIRYAWSGTPGDPLTRQYNGGTVVNVIDSAQQFDLTYNIKSVVDATATAPIIELSEQVLSSYDTVGFSWFQITNNDWFGQYFQPSLPVGTVSWRVSRVFIMASKQGAGDGITKVQLRTADAGNLPTSTVLEEQTLLESSLSALNTWEEFSFVNVTNLLPSQGLCIVTEWVQGASAAFIYLHAAAPTGLVTTTDAGTNWTHNASQVLLHYVYGYASAPDPAWVPPTIDTLQSITIDLQAGTDPRTAVELESTVLNQPVVP